MIITLTGTNSYALHQRLSGLTAKFVARRGGLALEKIDAENVDYLAILDAVQSLPFLSENKMIVIRELSLNKHAAEAIEQIISSLESSTDLIIVEPNIDKRTAYFKVLKAQTQLEEYNELDATALAKWLTAEAAKQGGKISLADADYLIERLGTNQHRLANELSKLLTFNKQISREYIDLLTEPTPQGKIFELLDAAFGGNKNKAIRLYEEQRAQKVEPQEILAMIAWQLRLLALAKYSKNLSAAVVAKDTGLNPYPITKAKKLAEKIGEPELISMVNEALEMDWRGKTTAIDLDEALKTYITSL